MIWLCILLACLALAFFAIVVVVIIVAGSGGSGGNASNLVEKGEVEKLLASAKACDAIMAVRIPPTAAKLRELLHCGQIMQSHALSFFHLSAPDMLLGFDSDPARRNVFGMIAASMTGYATSRISGLFHTGARNELQQILRSLAVIYDASPSALTEQLIGWGVLNAEARRAIEV